MNQNEVEPTTQKRLLGVENVSVILGMSHSWLYKMVKDGSLPAYRIGGRLRFDEHEVRAWVEKQKEAVSNVA